MAKKRNELPASATEAAPAEQASAVALAQPSAPISQGALLEKLAQGQSLSADEVGALQAMLAAKAKGGGGGKPAEPPPAFGSVSPQEAAALRPRLRDAYLAQGSRGYTLSFETIGPENAEAAAVALARKIGGAVMIREAGEDGLAIMEISPTHGQGDAAPRAMREGEKPTDQQAILIAQCTRPEGATGADLMAATGSTTPHSWPPALRSCERFGYSLRTRKGEGPKGTAIYHLDPVHSVAAANDAGAEGEATELQAAE